MTEHRPNIIFIMSDDHAAHAMSCYTNTMHHRNQINETPNIDRIAKEGVIFENCFCTNSLCTPSRASILTGKYSHKTGVTTIRTHLNNQIPTFAKMLHESGYQTAMIGKWHLGRGKKHYPIGFDYWNILPAQGWYRNPLFIEMGRLKRLKGYVTNLITKFSLNWLKNRDKSKPFLLLCHHKAPHRPWISDKKYKQLYKDDEIPYPLTFDDDYSDRAAAAEHAFMRVERAMNYSDLKLKSPLRKRWLTLPIPENFEDYKLKTEEGEVLSFESKEELKKWKYQRYIKEYLRCVQSVDDGVGKILEFLDEENLVDKTIIIYTSDQGFFLGDHGWYDKRFMYEESLRMPMVIRYPKEIKPGSINKDIITNIDFAETFLDYAEIEAPEDMQGRSFRHLLRGESDQTWRDSFYYRYWCNGGFHKVYSHYGIRTLKYKLIYYYCDPLGQLGAHKDFHEPEWEFFDLEKDPLEMKNEYSNPEYEKIIEDLKKELFELQKNLEDQPY